ncbi:type VII secretion integral membrane protein EccD [Mycobacterium sp.]|uniref:type VII secretion integral membrane protein EccD n=1 Tax=Mycobacterium sp. TaxID=1785 RepID=UPI003C750744
MHQALAVPTQSSGSHPPGAALRRLSVHADSGRVDLVLSAAVPIGSLIPSIVDILSGNGGYRAGAVAIWYQLSLPGNIALDSSKTLAQLGIRDGTALILTTCSAKSMAPRFDDAAEAVSASVAATERRWNRRAARLVGALVAIWLAGVSAAVTIRPVFDANRADRTGGVGVTATIALLTLAAAVIAYRVFLEPSAGLTLGMLASGFAALAGLLAVPGGPGAPNTLFAAAAAATSAAMMRVIGCHAVVFTALTCFAATGAAAAAVGALTTVPLPAIGAASTAISLALIEVSAPVSMMFARLSPQLPAKRLSAKVIRAHTWLTSLIVAFSASAALGAIGAVVEPSLTGGPRMPGTVFATVTGGVLLLRARAHRDLARSIPLIICGTATLSTALVTAAAAYPRHTAQFAMAAMLLASIALCRGFIDHLTAVSPVARRSVELLEYLALAVVVPLACWICGLYGAARSLNLL